MHQIIEKFWLADMKGKENLGDLGIDGRIILNCETEREGVKRV
jgi:hypothetical protein